VLLWSSVFAAENLRRCTCWRESNAMTLLCSHERHWWSWALLFGAGGYLFGEEIDRVTGPIGLLLLVITIRLVIAGILFFRDRERELERRADAALRGRS
jgi:hypothetical protein